MKPNIVDTNPGLPVDELIRNDIKYPRIGIFTAGSVGAGLDASNVYYVFRHGIPISLHDFFQELGRAGRNRNVENGVYTDFYGLTLHIYDVIYLIERMYDNTEPEEQNVSVLSTAFGFVQLSVTSFYCYCCCLYPSYR